MAGLAGGQVEEGEKRRNIFLGPAERAASIAILQAADTPHNEALVRTYHPAFAHAHEIAVYIKREKTGRRIWVITCTTTCCDWTHAGGLEIHYVPDRQFFYQIPHLNRPGWLYKNLSTDVEPRRLLSAEELQTIRAMFPLACGVRVWIGGSTQIVYNTPGDLHNSISSGVALCVGCEEPAWDVLDVQPSTSAMQDSDFVNKARDTFSIFWAIKDRLLRFRVPKLESFSTSGYVRAKDVPSSNNPIGKYVYMADADGNQLVGEIAETFDSPSHTEQFPSEYQHDLSLIKATRGHTLPEVLAPPGYPVIDGWASIEEALEGKPTFVSEHLAASKDRQEFSKASIQCAIAEGVSYHFRTEKDTSIALLWRTVPSPHEAQQAIGMEQKSVTPFVEAPQSAEPGGFSGSVLCKGSPTDATAKAIAMQNFELNWPETIFGPEKKIRSVRSIKGGFQLPAFITEHCTVDVGVADLTKAASSTMRKRPEYAALEGMPQASSVDGFQGQENDIMIVVMGTAFPQPGAGFTSNPQRLNFMLTRQRCGLVVVGHIKLPGVVDDGGEDEGKGKGKGRVKGPVKGKKERIMALNDQGEMVWMVLTVLKEMYKRVYTNGRVATVNARVNESDKKKATDTVASAS
ncbi:hypothetical protein LZ30DRAFT_688499 [Colletotrichum cereale]|nr:hypothetical protein LZ30DRAFT_688499 [Colletotrichum cereale]